MPETSGVYSHFRACQKNLVLYVPVGVGKTHIVIAVSIRAYTLGYQTNFYLFIELVFKLTEIRKNSTLENPRSLEMLTFLISRGMYQWTRTVRSYCFA